MAEGRNSFSLVVAGALTAGVGKARWEATSGGEIASVSATVGTAPTGATIILDLKKDGVTVFTTQANRPTIAIAATETADATTFRPDPASRATLYPGDASPPTPWTVQSGVSGTTPAVAAIGAFVKGATFTLDIAQVGSTVAGSDLEVTVEYVSL
jgi:hypothetical protein